MKQKRKIVNILVTDNEKLCESFSLVIRDLNDEKPDVSYDGDRLNKLYSELNSKAKIFLSDKEDSYEHITIYGTDILEATERLFSKYSGVGDCITVGMLVYFKDGGKHVDTKNDIEYYHRFLKYHQFNFKDSSYAVLTYHNQIEDSPFISLETEFQEKIFQNNSAILKCEVLFHYINYLESFCLGSRSGQFDKLKKFRVTLGTELINFLNFKSDKKWAFFSFTGSVVSGIIESIQQEIKNQNIISIKGPSEHSLATGAIANWQLNKIPFLIVVTSGMMDEFKGTLANLKETKAKGFIVCAENKKNVWFPFQGTINHEENMCDALEGKKIPYAFIDDVNSIDKKLTEAFQLYESNQGPVVILASHQVLESTIELTSSIPYPEEKALQIKENESIKENYTKILDCINDQKVNILWQCGDLTDEERSLVYKISEKTGIALCDSVTHPGSVSKYFNGSVNKYYLGTLGLYCFSRSIYNFLTIDGKLKPKKEQNILFLKNKLAQAATPFSEGKLKRELHISQVTNIDSHISPFTDIPFVTDSLMFLNHIFENLNVNRNVHEFRSSSIESAKKTNIDAASLIPSQPMYGNYFYARLNNTIEKLIKESNYTYTGIYDVGRSGISAIRNISKTGKGFSGWYGRALMGDAYSSVNTLAITSNKNIIGFIGDGAHNLVPDFRATLIENLMANKINSKKNVTFFIMMNGSLSMINTYRYQRFLDDGGRSGTVSSIKVNDTELNIGKYRVNNINMFSYDFELVKSLLLEEYAINFVYVYTTHNNEGDSITLLSENTWEHLKVEEMASQKMEEIEDIQKEAEIIA